MRALEGRLDAATWPEAPTYKAKDQESRIAYETALQQRREMMSKAADLRALRNAAKEDFLDVYASVAGRIKQAEFPRDRERQELFFDKLYARRSATEDPEVDDGDVPAVE